MRLHGDVWVLRKGLSVRQINYAIFTMIHTNLSAFPS